MMLNIVFLKDLAFMKNVFPIFYLSNLMRLTDPQTELCTDKKSVMYIIYQRLFLVIVYILGTMIAQVSEMTVLTDFSLIPSWCTIIGIFVFSISVQNGSEGFFPGLKVIGT